MSKCIICGNNIKQKQLSLSLVLTMFPMACRKCLPKDYAMILLTNGKYMTISKPNYKELNRRLKFKLPFLPAHGIVQVEKSYGKLILSVYKERFLTEEEIEALSYINSDIEDIMSQIDELEDEKHELEEKEREYPFKQVKFGGI